MADAPESDRQILDDPAWQEGFRGTLAIVGPWDIDVGLITCPVSWYHGAHDVNAPISAVRRLLDHIPSAHLTVWEEAGHMTAFQHKREVLQQLVGVASSGPGWR
jgi:pimeloyl-ACP methyl ester carboxylesterase